MSLQEEPIFIVSRRSFLVRDVLNPWTQFPLYAVIIDTIDDLSGVELKGGKIKVPGSFDRGIGSSGLSNTASLKFDSSALVIRRAEMEEDDGIPSDANYRPYIPYAPLYFGPIELGPERML